jgi:RluA family pseudouridine synthase
VKNFQIGRDDAGQRADRFLRKVLAGTPLGNVFKLLRKGVIRVNAKKAKPDQRLEIGDVVEIRLADDAVLALEGRPQGGRAAGTGRDSDAAAGGAADRARPHEPRAPKPRPLPKLDIVFRDEHVLAVDKPPFLLVQPGDSPDEPSLDKIILEMVGAGDSHTFHPALAHRLDRGTSGIVLVGLSAPGLRGLTEAFRHRTVEKRYLALVLGDPPADEFTVDLPLARDPSDDSRGARVKVSRGPEAQPAVTDFTVLSRSADRAFTLLECRPKTGRTHQIRAHLRAERLPIVGDPTYGVPVKNREWARRPGIKRQFLHAWKVRLAHPVTPGAEVAAEAPLPPDLVRVLRFVGMEPPASSL